MKSKQIKIWLLVTGIFGLSFPFLLSAQTATTSYVGVQSSIERYLCTPNTQNTGTTSRLGVTGQEGANNPASNDLYNCINRLYRFAIVAASAVAVFFIVLAGYVYMSADGNAESVDKAKSMLGSSIAAIVILFAGYVLLRALNPDLIQFKNVQPPSVRVASQGYTPLSNQEIIGIAGQTQGGSQTNPANVPPVQAGPGGTCPQSGKNLCQGVLSSGCKKDVCSQYNSAIQAAAQKISLPNNINKVAFLKALMYEESSCQINSQSGAGACGLMQLKPETANIYKSACGVTTAITCDWLKNPANAETSICIAAKYIERLSAANLCGADIRDITAAYNGGPAACNNSKDCAAAKSCDSGAVKAWECLYEDPAKQTCNKGYIETRNYVPEVLGCYNNQL